MDNQDDPDGAERAIEYTFRDHHILEEALKQSRNKRLAFLGDKVAGLMLIDHWYRSGQSCGRIAQEQRNTFADSS
jgi:dsRNA-specific ribonuclease